jgi:hypothetical protein
MLSTRFLHDEIIIKEKDIKHVMKTMNLNYEKSKEVLYKIRNIVHDYQEMHSINKTYHNLTYAFDKLYIGKFQSAQEANKNAIKKLKLKVERSFNPEMIVTEDFYFFEYLKQAIND